VAKSLLAAAGIPACPEHAAPDSEAAVAAAESIGYPVVLKILSPDILHKSEMGGVLLDIADASQVRHGFATLLDRARHHAPARAIEGVLVRSRSRAPSRWLSASSATRSSARWRWWASAASSSRC
jgi:acyl-CoA synthetase (NDP forming)